LRGLSAQGLNIVVHSEPVVSSGPAPVTVLEVVGQDRPGIVRQISEALARFKVNVEELETERSSAAMSGEMLFKARARLSIPPTCDLGKLRDTLERIAADLIVDVTLATESEPVKQARLDR
jgi:glycine cleavage system regulatory protein